MLYLITRRAVVDWRDRRLLAVIGLIVFVAFGFMEAKGAVVPPNFVETDTGYWDNAAGVVFDENGTMYQWDRDGRVWVIENDVRLAEPLIDIREEVGAWGDHGLLGFALHPAFLQNGYIYLLYVVDYHHLSKFGTPDYQSSANEYDRATIGRVSRYTARAADGFRSVDPLSRTVLIGQGIGTGIPMVSTEHGLGTLLFGSDGTLLVSCGDSATTTDFGSDPGTYYIQALDEGIIAPKENIGAFRAQLVDSLAGKILRIDPETGNGLPSNPFFDSANPRSARSRVWALGLRNPFRMCLKPGSGAHLPSEGNPGVIFLGDVGEYELEELNVVTGSGMNFGWPIFEGLNLSATFDLVDHPCPDAPNPLHGTGDCVQEFFTYRDLLKEATLGISSWPNPCDLAQPIPASVPQFVHSRPILDWRHGDGPVRTGVFVGDTADTIDVGAPGSPVSGPQFGGNCAIGGVFSHGGLFPPEFQNTYFFADLGVGWIRGLTVDSNNQPVRVRDFATEVGGIVAMAVHPISGELYYVDLYNGIHKISYGGNAPPVAVATADVNYGAGPLTVHFEGSNSSDAEGSVLRYEWDFGDGTLANTDADPTHVFNGPDAMPVRYDVRLTVTDEDGASHTTELVISVNNTPPSALIVSPADGTLYPVTSQTVYDLRAVVTDVEHATNQLSVVWRTDLHHNNHVHPGQVDTNWVTTTVASPIGCDGQTYFYRVRLTVTDDAGLSVSTFVDLYPSCPNTPPTISMIEDQQTDENLPVGPLPLTIGDAETAPDNLVLSATSSNPTVISPDGIILGGAGAERTLTIMPEPNRSGTASITVTVSDGIDTVSETFAVTVGGQTSSSPKIVEIRIAEDQVSLSVTGGLGPDYKMQVSTNLDSWVTLFTTNPISMPFLWTTTNSAGFPQRFYRVLLDH